MKIEALDHPKTLDFAARLSVELPTAIGHLELLWAFTGKKSPQGNIGKWPDGAIARACYWNGDPSVFVRALSDAGFIDSHPEHRYIVHDWHDHAFGWVRAKLKKIGQEFIKQSLEPSLERSSDASLEPSLDASQGSQVKSSQDKRKNLCASGDAQATRFAAFWLAYPRKKSKGDAEKFWKRINPNEQLHDRIMHALEQAKTSADWLKDNGQFIPYPATWLNAKGWEDELSTQAVARQKEFPR